MKDIEFVELALCHIEQLYRLAFARLGNPQDAEDVVQETYLRAYKSISTFQKQSNIKTWLTRILFNVIADHFRKSNRTISPLNLDESIDLDVSGPIVVGPEELLCASELLDDIRMALANMPDEFVAPLLLREFYDATYEEISIMLKIPKGTVMSRLSRARAQLKILILNNKRQNMQRETKQARTQS